MISNFFLDNRIGGPHIYSNYIKRDLKNEKFLNITCGKSNWSNLSLINIKRYNKYLYFFEIIINICEILINKNIKKTNLFFVFSIFNLAPIISGIFLKKKIYWFLIEDVTSISKFFFKIINFFYQIEIICINKMIAKKLEIKKYQVYLPKINVKFWRGKQMVDIKNKNKLIFTLVGNINRTKNYHQFFKFLENIHLPIQVNVIGEILKNQYHYYNKIKKILYANSIKVSFHGRKNKNFIKSKLSTSDLFFLPSLSEGTSISMLEAMSMGSICVVSKESNQSKIIKNGKNGFVFDLDTKSFKKILNKIINLNYSEQIKIRKRARLTILNNNLKFKL